MRTHGSRWWLVTGAAVVVAVAVGAPLSRHGAGGDPAPSPTPAAAATPGTGAGADGFWSPAEADRGQRQARPWSEEPVPALGTPAR